MHKRNVKSPRNSFCAATLGGSGRSALNDADSFRRMSEASVIDDPGHNYSEHAKLKVRLPVICIEPSNGVEVDVLVSFRQASARSSNSENVHANMTSKSSSPESQKLITDEGKDAEDAEYSDISCPPSRKRSTASSCSFAESEGDTGRAG